MAKEIERKFTVHLDKIKTVLQESEELGPVMDGEEPHSRVDRIFRLRQYYIVATKELAIRLRLEGKWGPEILTIKSGTNPMVMDEFEFPLPYGTYHARMSEMVGVEIDKIRHLINFDGRTWELDVFKGDLEGLIVAEIECYDAAEITNLPEWVKEDVTFDSRYKNAVLALNGAPA
jgi:adenylate cyclase